MVFDRKIIKDLLHWAEWRLEKPEKPQTPNLLMKGKAKAWRTKKLQVVSFKLWLFHHLVFTVQRHNWTTNACSRLRWRSNCTCPRRMLLRSGEKKTSYDPVRPCAQKASPQFVTGSQFHQSGQKKHDVWSAAEVLSCSFLATEVWFGAVFNPWPTWTKCKFHQQNLWLCPNPSLSYQFSYHLSRRWLGLATGVVGVDSQVKLGSWKTMANRCPTVCHCSTRTGDMGDMGDICDMGVAAEAMGEAIGEDMGVLKVGDRAQTWLGLKGVWKPWKIATFPFGLSFFVGWHPERKWILHILWIWIMTSWYHDITLNAS